MKAVLRFSAARPSGNLRRGCCRWASSLSDDLLVSMAKGAQISGSTNTEMVDSIVKAGLLSNRYAIKAMYDVDRADFISTCDTSTNNAEEAYANKPVSLGFGATVSTPQFCAEVLDLLSPRLEKGGKFLDIGSGSGYLSTLMSATAAHGGNNSITLGVDCFPPLVDLAKENTKPFSGRNTIGVRLDSTMELYFRHDVFPGNNMEFFKSVKGTFDCIYVAPCVQDVECIERLREMLNKNGRLIVPFLDLNSLEDEQAQGQRLMCIDKVEHSDEYVENDIMSVLCQPLMLPETIAAVESEKATRDAERAKRRTKAEIQEELKKWVDNYEEKTGRKPNRAEMLEDPVASVLFKEFSGVRG